MSLARWSTHEPGCSGAPPRTQHSRTVGAHSGQRPTSQTYAHTSPTLLTIVMRLSVLIVIGRTLQGGCSFRAAPAYRAQGRSVRSLPLVPPVPSRAGSIGAAVRRPVAGAGGTRRPASSGSRRRGQPDRREGPVGRGG